jgi:hypothetical protein
MESNLNAHQIPDTIQNHEEELDATSFILEQHVGQSETSTKRQQTLMSKDDVDGIAKRTNSTENIRPKLQDSSKNYKLNKRNLRDSSDGDEFDQDFGYSPSSSFISTSSSTTTTKSPAMSAYDLQQGGVVTSQRNFNTVTPTFAILGTVRSSGSEEQDFLDLQKRYKEQKLTAKEEKQLSKKAFKIVKTSERLKIEKEEEKRIKREKKEDGKQIPFLCSPPGCRQAAEREILSLEEGSRGP